MLLVAVDQMRADYLDRFGPQLTGGLRLLLDSAAVFTDAHQGQAITATAPGHAAMLSGLYPRDHGIVDNAWFDRRLNRPERAVADADYALVGLPGSEDGPGASPEQFRGTSLVDWLHDRDRGSRSVSISRKDRTAVLAAPRAQHAYWFHWSGRFITSTFYREELPGWVRSFNATDWLGDYAGATWPLMLRQAAYTASRPDEYPGESGARGFGTEFPHRLPENRQLLGAQIVRTPYMDKAVLDLGRVAVRQLDLGDDAVPDILALGLSSTDAVGHSFGPFSRELQDQILRLDRMLGEFLAFIDETIGLERVVVVLTSDHGVVALPEYSRELGDDAVRVNLGPILAALDEHLAPEFGGRRWFRGYSYGWMNVDRGLAARLGVDPEAVVAAAKDFFEGHESIAAVFSRADLLADRPAQSELELRARRSFYPDRSGDLYLVHPPLYLWQVGSAANHQSPYDYDSHVPLMIRGPGIRAGRYDATVEIVDLAPTLAALLGVEAPAGLEGTVRREIFAR